MTTYNGDFSDSKFDHPAITKLYQGRILERVNMVVGMSELNNTFIYIYIPMSAEFTRVD